MKIFRAGSLIVALYGQGKTRGQVAELGIDATVNQACAVIQWLTSFEDLKNFVRLSLGQQYEAMREQAEGGPQPNLNVGKIKELVFALPPLSEQHRIVAKVDELMALCDRLEAARANREATRDRLAASSLGRLNTPDPETFQDDARFVLNVLPALTTRPDQIKQFRQTILNLAVRGKVVPQASTDDRAPELGNAHIRETGDRLEFDLPVGWTWVRLADVADARLGKMLDKTKNRGKPIFYLGNTNVHWFDIRLDHIKTLLLDDTEFERYRLRRGDVLICEGGHGIGRTAVWEHNRSDFAFQKALHRVRPGKSLDSHFFSFCTFVYFHAGVLSNYFTGVGIPHFTGR